MLKPRLGLRTEELAGNRQRVCAKLGLAQFRREFDGVEELGQFCRTTVIAAREIILRSFFPPGAVFKKTLKYLPQQLHFRRRRNRVDRQVALLAKESYLVRC